MTAREAVEEYLIGQGMNGVRSSAEAREIIAAVEASGEYVRADTLDKLITDGELLERRVDELGLNYVAKNALLADKAVAAAESKLRVCDLRWMVEVNPKTVKAAIAAAIRAAAGEA